MRTETTELSWLSHLFDELYVTEITPIPLKCDNRTTIYIASIPIFHERTKHIEINYDFVHEKLQEGLIQLSHVDTKFSITGHFDKTTS